MIDKIVKLPDNLEYYVLDEVVYNRKIYFFLIQVSNLDDIVSNKCVVCEGKVLASLTLEIGGLITNRAACDVIEELKLLHEAIEMIAPSLDFNPFLTLSFLTLPVIPAIKLTDKGLFDVMKFDFISVVS